MLRELSVQNLALIEDARIELRDGYCAWTGETGAGKSLLLTALGLVLGGKASAELVRSGKEEARAAAIFDLSDDEALKAEIEAILGGPLDEDQLILTRRIGSKGRSVSHANGMPVPVATLRRIGPRLIDVHGQHETRTLLDPDRQRGLLDDYGGHDAVLLAYREAREAHDAIRRRRLRLIEAAQRRHRERELLTFERDELSAADPKPGEYEELSREARRLAGSEAIREAATEGYALLYDADRSAQALLGKVARRLEPLAESVPELGEASTSLGRMADEAREIAYALRGLADRSGDDPGRLEDLEARLALYRKLGQRFRCDPDGLASRLEQVEAELDSIDRDETDLQRLDAPLLETWSVLKGASGELTEARRRTCKAFAREVQTHLKDLSLGDARLAVRVEAEPMGDDPTACLPSDGGADRVEILFAPNPGEPTRPLRKIASGGELSRLTLAIKTVLAGVDRVPTLVFDEIDTGVGGRLGAVLGKKLAVLAMHHQVICVTHLPQMASYASHQWVIRKQTSRGRTRTTIEELESTGRIDELAAMLRGDSAAESTKQEAMAMLSEAQAAGAR
ncbi:DNA repair protein RecN [Tautonia plasticadhaerens]|uniref:DNA repair protein RecN n=1 Tax=Tautonia plasticadhaerens TaxID=2527974 RepID=A0A518GY06_9BACT|nr:DNA repair protein RecN [Tautonia plasticadhaerens]QDV33486.1 DNA repair protein RecN [Tautonia plasticadhaerens]